MYRGLILGVFLLLSCVGSTQAGGRLLVVGGALKSSNASVYQAFIDATPALGQIGIVPVASSRPAYYAEQFKADLIAYGVSPARIVIVPLALLDDPSSQQDESLWSNNAESVDVVKSLSNVKAYWFTGGDQTRITAGLLKADGTDTLLLTHIRRQLDQGGVVGGTSAGAAMMSKTMIASGDSLTALLEPRVEHYQGMESQESGPLFLQPGLGLLPFALVDQHFDRKARLGRMASTLCDLGHQVDWGIGVDEDTAALVDLKARTLTSLGAGNITLVDARAQQCQFQRGLGRSIQGQELSILGLGDSFDFRHETLTPALSKTITQGHEAFESKNTVAGGMAIPNARLAELLGFELLDNRRATVVERLSLFAVPEGLRVVTYRFQQTDKSKGFWGYLDGTKDSYTIEKVLFSVSGTMITTQKFNRIDPA